MHLRRGHRPRGLFCAPKYGVMQVLTGPGIHGAVIVWLVLMAALAAAFFLA